ncbi:MAG: toll/interleukin-1 receptor domain-containing protein [Polyangia bacterium]
MSDLANNPEVRDLVEGLSLADGFAFFLLYAESPEVIRDIIALLPDAVSQLRGIAVQVIRLDPTKGFEQGAAAFSAILRRLADPPAISAQTIWVLDGSSASPQNEEDWRDFFLRMNRSRNLIQKQLNRPLLLALPSSFERLFANSAPDFWSIRSSIAHITSLQAPAQIRARTSAEREGPLQLVYLCAPQDWHFAKELENYLVPLRRAGEIQVWSERHIQAGHNIRQQIKYHIEKADLILILASASFFDEERCVWQLQLALAEERIRDLQIVCVMLSPILLPPGLSRRYVLPANGRPISWSKHQDEEWLKTATALQEIVRRRLSAGLNLRKEHHRAMDRETITERLIEALLSLPPAQFDKLLSSLPIDFAERYSLPDTRLNRASKLVFLLEQIPRGLDILDEAIRKISSSSLS